MTYYAGLDVSLKEISICVVDNDGLYRISLPLPSDAASENQHKHLACRNKLIGSTKDVRAFILQDF